MNTTVTRSLSGLVFLAVMIGGLLAGGSWLLGLFGLMLALMLEEFYRMTLGSAHRTVHYLALAGAVAAYVLAALSLGLHLIPTRVLALIPLMLVVLLCVMVFCHQDFKDYAYVLAGLLYIALPICLVTLLSGHNILILAFFVLIWSSDTGAYCFGMLLGQKLWPAKLCPTISPKKSWAGAVGGMVSSLLAAWILQLVGWLPFPLVHVMAVAVLMNVAGVFGDLFESLWKRHFGLKDSGNLIPGHGGLLDRFDSALFAIPTGAAYLILNGLIL